MINDYRLKIRAQTHGNGIIYLLFIILLCLSCIVGAGLFITPLEWFHYLFILGCIIFSNFVEYMLHRFPMHIPIGFLKPIYKKHAGLHHRYFTFNNMGIDDTQDIFHVITSFKVVLLFIGGIILPITGLFLLINIQLSLLFFVSAMSYYLIYELTHLICHWKQDSIITKLPYFRKRREYHKTHHDSKLMRENNFNVSIPIMDLIFKTKI